MGASGKNIVRSASLQAAWFRKRDSGSTDIRDEPGARPQGQRARKGEGNLGQALRANKVLHCHNMLAGEDRGEQTSKFPHHEAASLALVGAASDAVVRGHRKHVALGLAVGRRGGRRARSRLARRRAVEQAD